MQAFTVVIALLAVALLGWSLSRAARRLLRRRGVPTDERDAAPVARPPRRESGDDGDAEG